MSLIEFKNISKFYQGFQACNDISFRIKENSIHALVGENGAGKSTLMKILGGLESATSGEIFVRSKLYAPRSAQDAFQNHIGFVHQHFLLAGNLTVLDHLILNWPKNTIFSFLNSKELIIKVETITEKFSWNLNFQTKISNLSVGDQQRIEILKALLADPEIIIFDEPTAVLAPQEIDEFLNFLKQLQANKKTIILISHKLKEIKNIANQITILRHGKSILTTDIAEMSLDDIAEKMIGRKMKTKNAFDDTKDLKLNLFNYGDLQFKKNHILGVIGIEGNGQSELIRSVRQLVKKKKITAADIPEDRIRYGLFPGLSLTSHMILRHPKKFCRYGFIQSKAVAAATDSVLENWDVRPHNRKLNIENLSGGNQQKFVIGRELYHDPDFILAAHPTRGVDLAAQEFIHTALIEKAKTGKTIFLLSSDLDEVLKLAHDFVILFKGQLFGPFKKNQLSETEIGQFMTGSHPHQPNYLMKAIYEI